MKMWKESHRTKCKETREEFKKMIFNFVPRSKAIAVKSNLQKRLRELAKGKIRKKSSSLNLVVKVVNQIKSHPRTFIINQNEDGTVFRGFVRKRQEEMSEKMKTAVMENRELLWHYFCHSQGGLKGGPFLLEIIPVRVQPREKVKTM